VVKANARVRKIDRCVQIQPSIVSVLPRRVIQWYFHVTRHTPLKCSGRHGIRQKDVSLISTSMAASSTHMYIGSPWSTSTA